MHFFVAKLLSIAVMTYYYVYHLRNLRPANLLRTQRINFSMRPQHVCMTGDPTVVWCLLSREPLRIRAETLRCQKLDSLPQICTTDSMCLPLFVFTQLFFESWTVGAGKTDAKQNLTWNNESRSFKVTHFGIWKANDGLRNRWKLSLSTTTLSFDVPSPGNLREYSHKSYTARNYSHWPTFVLRIVWVYLLSNFCGGFRKTHLFCNRVYRPFNVIMSSKVESLAPIERAYATSY